MDMRSEGAIWLLRDRLPDWDLGIVTVSEAHSSIEQMWHGIDPSHDLRDTPSAPVARDGLRAIYVSIDDLVGSLVQTFPDAEVVLFAMHGMGTNNADLASMVLLGELLFRKQFRRAYMRTPSWSAHLPNGVPSLPNGSRGISSWKRSSHPCGNTNRRHRGLARISRIALMKRLKSNGCR